MKELSVSSQPGQILGPSQETNLRSQIPSAPDSSWSDYLRDINDLVSTPPSHFPHPPKPTDVPKEELFGELTRTLDSADEIGLNTVDRTLLQQMFELADTAHATGEKPIRWSGDEYITHTLTVAIYAAQNGLVGEEVLIALGHDLTEDTDTDPEILRELFGQGVTSSIQELEKVSLSGKTKQLPEGSDIEAVEDVMTQDKIVEALKISLAIVLTKTFDTDHNIRTIDFDENTLRRIKKANRVLDLMSPVAKELGVPWRDIADIAFRQVQKSRYIEISERRDEFTDDDLIRKTQSTIELLSEIHIIEDGESTRTLNYDSMSTRLPGIYESSRGKGGSIKPNDVSPISKITATSEASAIDWFNALLKREDVNLEDTDTDPFTAFALDIPASLTLTLDHNDLERKIKVFISHRYLEIKPIQLETLKHLPESGSEPLSRPTPEEVSAAEKKLRRLISTTDFTEAGIAGLSANSLSETLKRGQIIVFDTQGNQQSLPNGSTDQDLAAKLGRNLFMVANGAVILRRGNIIEPEPGTTLEHGDRVTIITSDEQTISPKSYDLITTNKAIRDTTEALLARRQDSEIREKDEGIAYQRGVNILLSLYKNIRGKNLDIHLADGFDLVPDLNTDDMEKFLIKLGYVELNASDNEALEDWIDHKDSKDIVGDTFKLVEELASARDMLPSAVFEVGDKGVGVLNDITQELNRSGVSVLSMRAGPDHHAPNQEVKPSQIIVVFDLGVTDAQAKEALAEIQENLPSINITMQKSASNNEELLNSATLDI